MLQRVILHKNKKIMQTNYRLNKSCWKGVGGERGLNHSAVIIKINNHNRLFQHLLPLKVLNINLFKLGYFYWGKALYPLISNFLEDSVITHKYNLRSSPMDCQVSFTGQNLSCRIRNEVLVLLCHPAHIVMTFLTKNLLYSTSKLCTLYCLLL